MNNCSPITVKGSPRVSTPGKNLTGLPRTVFDTIADIHNVIQKWNSYHLKGIEIVTEIDSFKYGGLNNMDEEKKEDLNNSCLKLHNLFINCSEVVNNIKSFCERITAMVKLQNERNKEDKPFLTMPLWKIEKYARDIHKAYADELKNKKIVLENIAFCKTYEEAMFFKCLWKYQVDIGNTVAMNLHFLLLETGHRKIT